MLQQIVKLIRPKHWLKNGLVFVPLIFSGQLLDGDSFTKTLLATASFCFVASIVYVINDINDAARDRLHPTKKNRPIASGAISYKQAVLIIAALAILAAAFAAAGRLDGLSLIFLIAYLLINIGYSFGWKNYPIVDIGILASGFLIRTMYGAQIVDIEVSRWLFLTVLAGAFYLSLGKRRNELKSKGASTRKVNAYYNFDFLDKNMYVSMALTLVFYSLWATDPANSSTHMFWTIPLVVLIFMTYSLNVEKNTSSGDPVEVFFSNKFLVYLCLIFGIVTSAVLYL